MGVLDCAEEVHRPGGFLVEFVSCLRSEIGFRGKYGGESVAVDVTGKRACRENLVAIRRKERKETEKKLTVGATRIADMIPIYLYIPIYRILILVIICST